MGRAPQEAERDDVHALTPAAKPIGIARTPANDGVRAEIPLLLSRTALYRPGQGCTLLTEGAPPLAPAPPKAPAPAMSAAPWPEGDGGPVAQPSAALAAAVDRVFQETNRNGALDTRAVIVVKDGRIIAERYAPGFGASTPFLGWSATKSVTSALVGVLVAQGRLSLDAPAPVAAWRRPGDPRGAITLRNLLQMSSGLKFIEDYVPGSDSSQMLFHEADMAGYAASQPLKHPPGRFWDYSSGTANIVSRIVEDAVGGTLEDYDRFAREALFIPAGMTSMVIEPDERGTPVGSSYGYATARDWARFGQLYLDRGVVNGRRILPESWIDFTRSPASADAAGDYGAMFWLNHGPADGSKTRTYPHCPPDMYLANGHNGQFVAITPSKNAVVVRLGWTPEGRHFKVDRYFSGILNALT
jgi:CubicO group peptidase (beta-lactamase class C family)